MPTFNHNSFLTVFSLLLASAILSCEKDNSATLPVVISELPDLPEDPKPTVMDRHPERPSREITLAVVGEVRGELEPCGCPTLPFGGFERRATLLKRLTAQGPGPVFHLDAGDTLIKGFATKREDSVRTRAHEILRLSEMVGVDVWVPGPSDLVALKASTLRHAAGPPRISATWIDATGKHLLKPSMVVERDGIRLGVIGLSAAPPPDSGVLMKPPIQAVTEALAALPPGLDMVVGLGTITDTQAEAIASQVEGLTAVITTRGAAYEAPSHKGEQTPVIETPDRGRYLQVIHARLGTISRAPLILRPDPPTWRARLSATRRGEADKLSEVGRGRNLGLVSTIPLSADLAEPSAVSDRLATYRGQRLASAEARATKTNPHTPTYASSGSCVNCHSDEFARWTLTGHARAWMALVTRGETQNPECVACHTTAFGEPGGLGELTATNIRKFKGVQCEMCHGPLAGHPSDPAARATLVTEQGCRTCHDEANSPKFNFQTYLARASCQGGAPAVVPRPISE
jgi:hypothetical protein